MFAKKGMMHFIKDEVPDAQRFPLTSLAEKLIAIAPDGMNTLWKVFRSQGYGFDVCSLEDEIDRNDFAKLSSRRLLALARDSEQWFYFFDCYDPSSGLRFGVFDSYALFIEDSRLKADLIPAVKEILSSFKDVSQSPTPPDLYTPIT